MSHRIHTDLFKVSKAMADPGNGGSIRVTEDLQICEMESTTTETRTLENPTKPGISFILRLLTDGGDVVVTSSNGFNAQGETAATFADAGDMLSLISVTHSTGYRWQIMEGNVGAVTFA